MVSKMKIFFLEMDSFCSSVICSIKLKKFLIKDFNKWAWESHIEEEQATTLVPIELEKSKHQVFDMAIVGGRVVVQYPNKKTTAATCSDSNLNVVLNGLKRIRPTKLA